MPKNLENPDFEEIKSNSYEKFQFEEEIKNFPELTKGKDLWQNKFHEFDVYEHSLKFVEFIKKFAQQNNKSLDPNIVAAAYLHDIGKPVIAKEKIKDGILLEKEPGKPYHEFDDHEILGEQMVRKMPNNFFDSYSLDQEKVAKLVGAHFIPMKSIKQMRKTTNFLDFVSSYHELEKRLDETGLTREEVMELFVADSYAKGTGCTDLDELIKTMEAVLSGGQEEKIKELYKIEKSMYGNKE